MDLSKIIAISGKPGLYSVVSQIKNGVIVESVEDGKRFPAYSTNQISALKDISIYTSDEELPLADVFAKIKAIEGEKIEIDSKAGNEEFRSFFTKVLPEHDAERVYISDIKKVVKWYNLLSEKNLLIDEAPQTEEAAAEDSDVVEDAEIIEESPKPKAKKTKKAE